MRKLSGQLAITALVGVAALAPGCVVDGSPRGTFDKTLNVTGPVELNLQNRSGDVVVRAGAAGVVRIRAEVRLHDFFWDASSRVDRIVANPPIVQSGSVIRVGDRSDRLRGVSITYNIEVPAKATVRLENGSGDLETSGIEGSAEMTTGSGDIRAHNIRQGIILKTGSGDIELRDAGRDVRANTGSGDILLAEVDGDVLATTGSGDITVQRPGGRVTLRTGSGEVELTGAPADVRIRTGSGNIRIEADPAAKSYWDLETGSGDIRMDVSSAASFLLFAHARSRDIDSRVPMTIEEQSRRELRARVGKGEARVEVRTSSGSVRIR
jgi:DUF4097 and DUF4098 domain-containing protein YvlB